MMKNLLKVFKTDLLAIILLLSFGNCKKGWLDVKPDQSLAVPTELAELQAMLDNVDVMNSQYPHLQEVASDCHYFVNVSAFNSVDDNIRNAYTWSKAAPYTYEPGWRISYQRILFSNLVLEALDRFSPAPAQKGIFDDIEGQALFHRAKSFFELAQVWAPPYDKNTSASALSIPLRLTSNVNSASVRSTVEETYSQIIEDLQRAKNQLPDIGKFKTRPSKAAVYALLSRIYLSMEEYSQAKVHADSCLLLYDYLLDYNTVANSGTYPMPLPQSNPEIIFYNTINSQGIRAPQVRVDSTLYKSLKEEDLRKTLCFSIVSDGIRYRGFYGPTGSPFGGLTTAEIYLIRAECHARAGDVPAATRDLDSLLVKRWRNTVPYTPVSTTEAEETLMQILIERKRELLFRGIRWSDLRRLNRDTRFSNTIYRSIDGKAYSLEPNSFMYTFPIPDDVIINTGMVQNPGWN